MTREARADTGIAGLDEILHGGFQPGRAYMIRGDPGAGKTILGLHYLTADPEADVLFVAFEEREADIRSNAADLGFDLSGVEILDLSPDEERFLDRQQYTVFAPDEVEGPDVVGRLADRFREDPPDRVFIDPLSQVRDLSADDHQFRQEAASMFGFLRKRGVTVLFTTQPTTTQPDEDLEFLADGAIRLDRSETGRTIEVTKFRGSDFQEGRHTLEITESGLEVFPKVVPEPHEDVAGFEQLSTGTDNLDELLDGGLERGSITVISGPTGVGKSTTATAILRAAAERGERAAGYLFEESVSSLTHRQTAIGAPVDDLLESDDLYLETVEPLAMSADEFAHHVIGQVEERGVEMVLIDGVAGYQLSLGDERGNLVAELHALSRELRNRGVTVLLTEEIAQVTGPLSATGERLSYLADSIVFLRYLEVDSEMRKAIGVLKKRLGSFEPTLRWLDISADGLQIGERVTDIRGALTATPEFEDDD